MNYPLCSHPPTSFDHLRGPRNSKHLQVDKRQIIQSNIQAPLLFNYYLTTLQPPLVL